MDGDGNRDYNNWANNLTGNHNWSPGAQFMAARRRGGRRRLSEQLTNGNAVAGPNGDAGTYQVTRGQTPVYPIRTSFFDGSRGMPHVFRGFHDRDQGEQCGGPSFQSHEPGARFSESIRHSQTRQRSAQPWKKLVLCRYYESGTCIMGSSCLYFHPDDPAQPEEVDASFITTVLPSQNPVWKSVPTEDVGVGTEY